MTTLTIQLPWLAPQLSLNKRLHWGKRARITADVRSLTAWHARNARTLAGNPTPTHLHVTLHWQPAQNRKRDSHNMLGDLKAQIDGLVDAGWIPDDNDLHLTAWMPRIHPVAKPARMWLELAWNDVVA